MNRTSFVPELENSMYDRHLVPFSFVRKKDDSLLFERNDLSRQEYGHFISRAPFPQQLQLVIPSGEAPMKG